MGFGNTRVVREAVAPFKVPPVEFEVVALDMAAVTMRQINAIVFDKQAVVQTDDMREASFSVLEWLKEIRCFGDQTKTIYLALHENPPKLKEATQKKRAKSHSEVKMPSEIVKTPDDLAIRRREMLNFVRKPTVSVALNADQARALVHGARREYAQLAVESLTAFCIASNIALESHAILLEGEASAFRRALQAAQNGQAAVAISNDTDMMGYCLAHRADVAAVTAPFLIYDFLQRTFVDAGAFCRSMSDLSARAMLQTWISTGNDYMPHAIADKQSELEAMFALCVDGNAAEIENFLSDRLRDRAKRCPERSTDGKTYFRQMQWVLAYFSAKTPNDVPCEHEYGFPRVEKRKREDETVNSVEEYVRGIDSRVVCVRRKDHRCAICRILLDWHDICVCSCVDVCPSCDFKFGNLTVVIHRLKYIDPNAVYFEMG